MAAAWASLAGFFFLSPAEARRVEDALLLQGHAGPDHTIQTENP
jgi:hypothetical protein